MAHTCASFDHEGARLIFDTEKKGYRINGGLITHELMSVDEYDDELRRRQETESDESAQQLVSEKAVIATRHGEVVAIPFRDFFDEITNPSIQDFLKASRTFLVRKEVKGRSSGGSKSNLSDITEITLKYKFAPCIDAKLIEALEEYHQEINENKGSAR